MDANLPRGDSVNLAHQTNGTSAAGSTRERLDLSPAKAAQQDLEPVPRSRLLGAKGAYTTRHLIGSIQSDGADFQLTREPRLRPRSGDVTLARVTAVGQHPAIENPGSRRALLFCGDEVLVAFGNRYAPDQFEAEVPQGLGTTHLVAAGGVAGQMLSRHNKMANPTAIEPLGLLARDGQVVNLADYAPYRVQSTSVLRAPSGPPVVAVVGTSMDSGKTTVAAALVRGLTAAGLRVCAGKVTGTGAGRDPWLLSDSGAEQVLDFTDFGHPSTYLLSFEEIRGLFAGIVEELGRRDPDLIVLEVADGLLQEETAMLLADPLFREGVRAVVFTAVDAVGAVAGARLLEELDLRVAAVSGLLTAAPLAAREARSSLHTPVVATDQLADAVVAARVLSEPLGGITGRTPTLVAQ